MRGPRGNKKQREDIFASTRVNVSGASRSRKMKEWNLSAALKDEIDLRTFSLTIFLVFQDFKWLVIDMKSKESVDMWPTILDFQFTRGMSWSVFIGGERKKNDPWCLWVHVFRNSWKFSGVSMEDYCEISKKLPKYNNVISKNVFGNWDNLF